MRSQARQANARAMSTDLNRFSEGCRSLVQHVLAKGATKDDWDSRCGRLSGFGLANPVRANPSHQARTITAIDSLAAPFGYSSFSDGMSMRGSYPAMRYHPTHGEKRVEDEDEDLALGEGWSPRPV